jgi:hypothetical protein
MAVTINGSAGVTTNSGAVYNGLQTDTAKASTSGTSVDFTGIPSWVKRITVMFSGVSTSGTSVVQIQLGDSGGFETTGYSSGAQNGNNAPSFFSAGFPVESGGVATWSRGGQLILSLVNSNTWVYSSCMTAASAQMLFGSGVKTLSDTLTQVRITTVNGTDTFDAGTINIIYE